MRDKFDVEFTTGLTAKKSPDFVEVVHKAVAGVSEKDLIERNTIGEVKDTEDKRAGESEDQSEEQPEQEPESNV
jgi:hypothetical protein